jgi:hypothetical protein
MQATAVGRDEGSRSRSHFPIFSKKMLRLIRIGRRRTVSLNGRMFGSHAQKSRCRSMACFALLPKQVVSM